MCWALIPNKIHDGGYVGCRKKKKNISKSKNNALLLLNKNYLKIRDIFKHASSRSNLFDQNQCCMGKPL